MVISSIEYQFEYQETDNDNEVGSSFKLKYSVPENRNIAAFEM